MSNQFINNTGLPFCKGCGHTVIANNTEKALQKLNYATLDTILVTDIGCHGIIDKSFNSHTFHGLHGRSAALAAGLTVALNNPKKKVIVFIGDGGSTIGMQHLIDSAHNRFNMTVVIHNNMLYGMTGGQPSELTLKGFKTPTDPEGFMKTGYNICEIMVAAGAGFVERIMGVGDFSDKLAEAFAFEGFSVIEVMEICPSYGVKSNPGMKLSKVVEDSMLPIKNYVNRPIGAFSAQENRNRPSLFDEHQHIKTEFNHNLTAPVKIMFSGSAGEGVQSAVEMLANAAVRSGLNVTKKGSYPVTVGIGFSAAELIISPKQINYTGTVILDYMVISSLDGFLYAKSKAESMDKGVIYMEETLPEIEARTELIKGNFREKAGARSACMLMIFKMLKETGIIPLEAMISVYNDSKLAQKQSVTLFTEAL